MWHSLGIGVLVHGVPKQAIIVRADTGIPFRRSHTVSTFKHGQESVNIQIYKGKSLMGVLKIKGLTRAPAGQTKIEVIFDIDDHGLLTVTAVELSSGVRHT